MALLLMEFSWNRLNEQSLDSLENENSTTLTIMTYNLFFKNGAPNSSIKNIQEVNPDILVIQEVTPTWEKDLDQTIGVQYPYKMTLALKGTHGIGVYSKYPLKSNQYLPAGSKYPFAQMLEIEVNSKRIQLVSVHLASPAAAVEQPDKFLRLISKSYVEREKQIREINALMEYDSFDAQIFIGDLNTTQYEPLYRKLTNDWVDLFEEVGVGSKRNFPNTSKMKPVLTLDYIFIRGKAKAIESNVIQGGSSDHLALSGKFEI